MATRDGVLAKAIRSGAALLALALGAIVQAGEIPASMDPGAVPNYKRVRPDLATAGQPTPETLKKLKELGFKTVVSLRTAAEPDVKQEETILRELGLNYVSVPVTPASFSLEDVKAVGKVLDDPSSGPVLLHCSSANRVGAVWTVLEAHRGKSYEEAEAEGKAIGLQSPLMIEAVRRLLGKQP